MEEVPEVEDMVTDSLASRLRFGVVGNSLSWRSLESRNEKDDAQRERIGSCRDDAGGGVAVQAM